MPVRIQIMSAREELPPPGSNGDAAEENLLLLNANSDDLDGLVQEKFRKFLDIWEEGDIQDGGSQAKTIPFYHQQISRLRVEDSRTLTVDWTHLVAWNPAVAQMIMSSFYRLEPSLRKAVQEVVRVAEPEFAQVSVFGLGASGGRRGRHRRGSCRVQMQAQLTVHLARRRRMGARRSSTCPSSTCWPVTSCVTSGRSL